MNAVTNRRENLENISFSQLSDVCRELTAKGVTPSIDALVKLAPHPESEIRQQLPLVLLLDQAIGQDSKPSPNAIPKSIAGCVLQEEIGRGGMGIVFRAHQPEMNRDVAVKVIRLNADMRNQESRFERERHAMARLDHPHIVPAYSYTQDDKFAYLVMKLIKGHGLNQLLEGAGDYKAKLLIQEIRNDWSCFAEMAANVASGLHHAHECGLIHRDVKPGNLLIDPSGKVWITDFGLAKTNDNARSISRTGDIVGTPKYMAPEQIHGICDPRSDIYSLGMTLYEIAAGQSARGQDWRPNQVLENSIPQIEPIQNLRPEIPGDLAHVIMKACRYLPDERYQSAHELEVVLRRFLDGRVADRRKKKRKPDAVYRREFRRNAAIAVIGSMLLCSLATWVFLRDPGKPQTKVQWDRYPTPDSANILNALADSNGKRVGDIDREFGEKLRDSLVEASKQLQLPDAERNELVSEVNVMYEQIKNRNLSHKELGALIDNYHDSNLATATKIWRFVPIIQASAMSPDEKQRSNEILHRFAYLSTKDRISLDNTIRLMNSLTEGRSVTGEELAGMQFSTSQLRTWINKIDEATHHLMQPGEVANLADDIRQIFSTSLESSEWPHEIDLSNLPVELTPEQIEMYKAQLNGIR